MICLCPWSVGVQIHARDEKTDLPNVKGEVKRAIKATFAHLCTTLTRDKCLPLLAVRGESSGDKGRFCHAFNPYLWRASKVYFISICTPIKGVVKYVWDSGQRCDKSAVKLCLWLKSKACEKPSSNVSEPQVRCVTKLSSNASEIQVKGLIKVLPNMIVFFPPLASRFSLVSRFAWIPRSPRASRECRVIASLVISAWYTG